MKIGIRKILTYGTHKVYFVKTKTWKSDTWSVRSKPGGDCYIISRPENFKDWHKNDLTQMIVLHEFGHCNFSKHPIHFVDETRATLYGYFKYKHLSTNVTLMSMVKLIRASWSYAFRWKSNFSPLAK